MILLDTHVLLWVMTDDDQLGRRAAESITAAGRVHISSISMLELEIKAMLGHLTLPERLGERLDEQGFTPLPFAQHHAAGITQFEELKRHDPFDRALLAQAAEERLSFLTADRRLLALDLPFVVDARR